MNPYKNKTLLELQCDAAELSARGCRDLNNCLSGVYIPLRNVTCTNLCSLHFIVNELAERLKVPPLDRLFKSCGAIRDVIFRDCQSKNLCSPMEADLNPDFHVEVTLTIAEIREFCFATRDAAHEARPAVPSPELATMSKRIDSFWQMVSSSWDIEPRAFFEAEAPKSGDWSPEAMAAHHMWKRDAKVEKLAEDVAALSAALESMKRERDGYKIAYETAAGIARESETQLGALIAERKANKPGLLADIEDAMRANNQSNDPAFRQDVCTCDPTVGHCPCAYCVIHETLRKCASLVSGNKHYPAPSESMPDCICFACPTAPHNDGDGDCACDCAPVYDAVMCGACPNRKECDVFLNPENYDKAEPTKPEVV